MSDDDRQKEFQRIQEDIERQEVSKQHDEKYGEDGRVLTWLTLFLALASAVFIYVAKTASDAGDNRRLVVSECLSGLSVLSTLFFGYHAFVQRREHKKFMDNLTKITEPPRKPK